MPEATDRVFYHLHVAGFEQLSDNFRGYLRVIGLYEDNFDVDETSSGVPLEHWTKTYYKNQKDLWKQESEWAISAAHHFGFEGYVEAEAVGREIRLDNYENNPSGAVRDYPYQLTLRELSGRPGDEFKKAELHVEMKQDSNGNLIDAIRKAGFQELLWQDEVIFTAQGDQDVISTLTEATIEYIHEQGGVRGLHIVQETVPPWGYKYFGEIDHRNMSQVIDQIIREK